MRRDSPDLGMLHPGRERAEPRKTLLFRLRVLVLWSFVMLLAAGALFLAFRGVNWNELLSSLQRARPRYIIAACSVLTVSYCMRGLRWRVLLSAEKLIAPGTVFWASMVGYLGNNYLPARAGEIIRSALLGRRAGISKSFVLATAITERVMDLIALVLISLVAAATLGGLPAWLISATKVSGLMAVAVFLLLYGASRSGGLYLKLLTWAPVPARLRSGLVNVTGQFLLGTRAILHPSRALSFAAMTVAIWLMDASAAILAARALALVLTLPQALVLLAALGLASALPSTPGALGIYQLVAVTILMPVGYSRDAALAYILVLQACSYAVVTLWGGVGVWRLAARDAGATRR